MPRALQALGYQVATAESGHQAIAMLDRNPSIVRAALVDVTMPGLTGGETADALRELRPDLPILFMSGHGSEEVRRRLRSSEHTAHIPKPFLTADLGAAIARILDA